MCAKYYKSHGSNANIRDRMNVIYLRSKGYSPGACADAAGVHPNSVTRWTKMYIASGIKGLLQVNCYRPQSDLLNYKDQIAQSFTSQPPRSIAEAKRRIKILTGLDRGTTQIRKFLKEVLGFRYRKFRPLPGGKKSIEDLAASQATFLKDTLEPLLDKALRSVVDVYFVDAAHPIQGFHSGSVWSKVPIGVRTSNGRDRMNILGALHATNRGIYSLTTSNYISASSVAELIEYIREDNPGRRIYLVMDNARYQRCRFVAKVAARKNVHLVFQPAYSPNLNLIERFWKFLKSTVLAGVYYESKSAFREAIHSFMEQVNQGKYDDQLRSLLTLNFQTLKAT